MHTKYPKAHLVLEVYVLSLGVLPSLLVYHPQRQHKADRAGSHGNHVRGAVTLQPLRARALTVRADDAMLIENDAIEQVEDVAREDRRHGHEAPVLRQAVNAKALSYDGREHAEQEAVPEPRQTGYEAEEVRVDNA